MCININSVAHGQGAINPKQQNTTPAKNIAGAAANAKKNIPNPRVHPEVNLIHCCTKTCAAVQQ